MMKTKKSKSKAKSKETVKHSKKKKGFGNKKNNAEIKDTVRASVNTSLWLIGIKNAF